MRRPCREHIECEILDRHGQRLHIKTGGEINIRPETDTERANRIWGKDNWVLCVNCPADETRNPWVWHHNDFHKGVNVGENVIDRPYHVVYGETKNFVTGYFAKHEAEADAKSRNAKSLQMELFPGYSVVEKTEKPLEE